MRKCFSTKHLRYGSFFIVISIKNKPPTSGLRVTLKVAHNPEVGGSNPSPATIKNLETITVSRFFLCLSYPLRYDENGAPFDLFWHKGSGFRSCSLICRIERSVQEDFTSCFTAASVWHGIGIAYTRMHPYTAAVGSIRQAAFRGRRFSATGSGRWLSKSRVLLRVLPSCFSGSSFAESSAALRQVT